MFNLKKKYLFLSLININERKTICESNIIFKSVIASVVLVILLDLFLTPSNDSSNDNKNKNTVGKENIDEEFKEENINEQPQEERKDRYVNLRNLNNNFKTTYGKKMNLLKRIYCDKDFNYYLINRAKCLEDKNLIKEIKDEFVSLKSLNENEIFLIFENMKQFLFFENGHNSYKSALYMFKNLENLPEKESIPIDTINDLRKNLLSNYDYEKYLNIQANLINKILNNKDVEIFDYDNMTEDNTLFYKKIIILLLDKDIWNIIKDLMNIIKEIQYK
jgi:hypothetical protein